MPDLGRYAVPLIVEAVEVTDRSGYAVHVDVEVLSLVLRKVDRLIGMDTTAPAKIVMRDIVLEAVVCEVFGTSQQPDGARCDLE